MRQSSLIKQPRTVVTATTAATTLVLSCLFSAGFSLSASAQLRPDRPEFFELGRDQFESEIDLIREQQPDSVPILDVNIESPQWSAVLLREGGGMVWMPQGILSDETRTVESVDGTIDFEIIATDSAIGRFVVAYSGQEASFASADPSELLDRVRNKIIGDQTDFGAVGDRPIKVNDNPGRTFILQNSEEVITYQVFLVDDRLYVMAVSQPADSAQTDAIESFFNSFQSL